MGYMIQHYFKAIKSGIIKILPKDKQEKTKDQIEYEIGQLVSKSIISEEVVDIFASVGLNKPDISILSVVYCFRIKIMLRQTFPSYFFPFCSGSAVIAVWIN